MTLREAVQAGTARVTEISEHGSVPQLRFENTGKRAVLILDGEELIGAKQNRTANVTILATAGKTLDIPVTCVEAGRWGYNRPDSAASAERRGHKRPELAPSDAMHFSRGRQRKMSSVNQSLRAAQSRAADQRMVWGDIQRKSASMGVSSSTSAMSDVYREHRTRVDDYVGAFKAEAGQTGAVFAIGETVEGLELFDCEETFAEMLPKLIRSYAIDAIESVQSHRRNPSAVSADAFISKLVRAEAETYPAVGEGTEVRLSAPGAIAAALVTDERVVHLAGFSAPAEENRQGNPGEDSGRGFARFRTRRRMM